MPDTRVKLALTPQLLSKVDQARGDIPRQRWLSRLVEQHFEQHHPGQLAARVETDGTLTPIEPVSGRELTELHQRGRPHTPGYPLLDHAWVGIGARCLRVGCESPTNKEAHL